MTEKSRENKARRLLAKQGYSLHKSRVSPIISNSLNVDNYGGYQIVDSSNNFIVAGEKFNLSIEDVEKFIAE